MILQNSEQCHEHKKHKISRDIYVRHYILLFKYLPNHINFKTNTFHSQKAPSPMAKCLKSKRWWGSLPSEWYPVCLDNDGSGKLGRRPRAAGLLCTSRWGQYPLRCGWAEVRPPSQSDHPVDKKGNTQTLLHMQGGLCILGKNDVISAECFSQFKVIWYYAIPQ